MALIERLKIAPQVETQSEEQLAQDPEPDERPGPKGRTTTRRAPAPRSPTVAKMAKDVAEDLTTLIEMTAAAWSLTDQCCAPVLAEQAQPTAKALTAILARNPRLLARFAQADTAVFVMQATALARALLPVARAIYTNHVAAKEGNDGAGLHLDQFPVYGGPLSS